VQQSAAVVAGSDLTEAYLRGRYRAMHPRCQIFRPKKHQNRLRLGLRTRPRWRVFSASPDPLVGFKGDILLSGGKGQERRGGVTS